MEVSKSKLKTFSTSAPQKCKYLSKDRCGTIYCLKLDQWLSEKYCSVCRFRDNYSITPKPLFHNYSYNYNITRKIKRTNTKRNDKSLKLTFSCIGDFQ